MTVLLLSGGKDSAWVALYLARHQVRVTALTIDTGFMAPAALSNTTRLCSLLGMEQVILKPDMTAMLRAEFLKRGPALSTVDWAEGTEIFRLGTEFAAVRGAILVCGLSGAQVEIVGGNVWSPLADLGISEEQVQRDIAHLGLVTSPLRTNSRLMAPMLVLDTRRTGRSSFRPYLTAWYWRFVLPALEALARVGFFDAKANRVLAELDLSLELCSPS